MHFLAPRIPGSGKPGGLVWDRGRLRSAPPPIPPTPANQMKVNQRRTLRRPLLPFAVLSAGCSDEGAGGYRLRQRRAYHRWFSLEWKGNNNRLILEESLVLRKTAVKKRNKEFRETLLIFHIHPDILQQTLFLAAFNGIIWWHVSTSSGNFNNKVLYRKQNCQRKLQECCKCSDGHTNHRHRPSLNKLMYFINTVSYFKCTIWQKRLFLFLILRCISIHDVTLSKH